MYLILNKFLNVKCRNFHSAIVVQLYSCLCNSICQRLCSEHNLLSRLHCDQCTRASKCHDRAILRPRTFFAEFAQSCRLQLETYFLLHFYIFCFLCLYTFMQLLGSFCALSKEKFPKVKFWRCKKIWENTGNSLKNQIFICVCISAKSQQQQEMHKNLYLKLWKQPIFFLLFIIIVVSSSQAGLIFIRKNKILLLITLP